MNASSTALRIVSNVLKLKKLKELRINNEDLSISCFEPLDKVVGILESLGFKQSKTFLGQYTKDENTLILTSTFYQMDKGPHTTLKFWNRNGG